MIIHSTNSSHTHTEQTFYGNIPSNQHAYNSRPESKKKKKKSLILHIYIHFCDWTILAKKAVSQMGKSQRGLRTCMRSHSQAQPAYQGNAFHRRTRLRDPRGTFQLQNPRDQLQGAFLSYSTHVPSLGVSHHLQIPSNKNQVFPTV